MDRLSDHRFVANYFCLYLRAAATKLLVRLRRFLAEPLPAPAVEAETAPAATQQRRPLVLARGGGPARAPQLGRLRLQQLLDWGAGCGSANA
jgi:hypothetical protein